MGRLFTSRRLAALSLVTGALLGCPGQGPNSEGDGGREESAAPVEVALTEVAPVVRSVRGTAALAPAREVEIAAAVEGVLVEARVEAGATVKRGQTLAVIRNPRLDVALGGARAALARLEREVSRSASLAEKGVISATQLDDLRFQRDQARNDLRTLSEQVAELRPAATLSGLVAERLVEPGARVVPGSPLFRLMDVSHLELELRLPERHLSSLALGQRAELRSAVSPGSVAEGELARVAPVVDARSGTVKVTLSLTPEAAEAAGLRPGALVEAKVLLGEPAPATLVPRRAVSWERDPPVVWRVKGEGANAIAEPIEVQLGSREGERVAVDLSTPPLAAGDRVVVLGQGGLAPGASVRVVAGPGASEEPDPPSEALDPPAAGE